MPSPHQPWVKGRCKKPGRFYLTCTRCKKEFSTHSTNRKQCHTCLPKCREIHAFHPAARRFFEKVAPAMGAPTTAPVAPAPAPTQAYPAAYA
jgi:hypothetical protein